MLSHYDKLALDLLLDGAKPGDPRLVALSAQAMGYRTCPHCGLYSVHDDNGATGSELSFSCDSCGECFDDEACK